MSHEITERDGLFTVRQPAWHGLGTLLEDYPTRADAQHFSMPWEPVAEPVFRRVVEHRHPGPDLTRYEEITGMYLNARSDDGHVIGVVNDSFTTVSNNELWDIAEAIEGEDTGAVQYETGGSLKGGRKVWLLLRLREPIVIPGDPRGATIPYYSLQNSHDGSGAFRGQATMTRIVCDNTSQIADMDSEARGTSFEFRHTKNVHDLRLTDEQVTLFIEQFVPMPPPHATSDRVVANVDKARGQLREILAGPTCEGIGNTGYGMVQASVEYLNHVRKAQSTESRFKRAYLERSAITADAVELAEAVARS
jgi:hypothetical protein